MLQTVIIVLKKGHSDEFVLKETLYANVTNNVGWCSDWIKLRNNWEIFKVI